MRLGLILAVVIYSILGFLDIPASYENKTLILTIRYAIICPLFIISLLISYRKRTRRYLILSIAITIIITSIALSVTILLSSEPISYSYYAALIILLIFQYFFFRLPFWITNITGFLIIIIYKVASIFIAETNSLILTNYGFFFISINIIGMFTIYSMESLLRKDFIKRRLLINEKDGVVMLNKNLEKEIEEQTKYLVRVNKDLTSEIKNKKKIESSLFRSKEKAEESDRLKTAFLANMSHEIRTPANGILGIAELMKNNKLSEEEKNEYLDIIILSGKLLLNIVGDILDISQIEANQIDIKKKPIDLDLLMKKIHENANNEKCIKDKEHLEIILKPENKTCNKCIKADYFQLTKVLNNLMFNAIKFTQKGSVEFGYKKKDEKTLLFYVKDTGIGFPKEKEKLMFERFTQIEDAFTRRYGGTGLGLAISKGLIEMMDGKIWVEAEMHKGSTFYFTIPYEPINMKE